MNVKEKLAFFSKVATQEAQSRRLEILRDIEQRMNEAVREITLTAKKQADERLRSETYKIERKKNKEIIQASTEARKNAVELRSRLIQGLFDGVTERLRKYTESEEYKTDLTRRVAELIQKHNRCKIFISKRDVPLLKFYEDKTEIVPVDDDYIGGFKLMNLDKNSLEDYTYQSRLKDERERFNELKLADYGRGSK
ncbi:MAG: V-type ATP synthase subunit E [Clostridiales bacterium]|nr:V-type ATP synthase subunit E [Clostridiales bacterium]